MAAVMFDTHKFVRKLKESGFEEKQAEGIAEAFQDASAEAELATKRDVELIRAEIRELKTEMTGEMKLNRWMLGAVLGVAIANFAKQFL
jgi:hypothetical protein